MAHSGKPAKSTKRGSMARRDLTVERVDNIRAGIFYREGNERRGWFIFEFPILMGWFFIGLCCVK